ncbi:hypothetical protein CLU79DRAFT_802566 [Phycomyces nitens]|nr:hypothetical protein CLU79DRAFT_802566 [Phycomyces nitens]
MRIYGHILNTLTLNIFIISHLEDIKLRRMLYTDGIGVSVLKHNSNIKSVSLAKNEFQYVDNLEEEMLQAGIIKCVVCDYERCTLLYLMHKEIYKKPKSCRNKSKTIKTDCIIATDFSLSQYSSLTTDKEILLPFRKIKLSIFINRLQAGKCLAENIWKKKFGNDAILLLGNWSAGQIIYYKLIRDSELRKILTNEGFQVYLIGELKTSSMCPTCQNGKLQHLKKNQKYRQNRRRKILQDNNHQCLKLVIESTEYTTQSFLYRFWNGYMTTINFGYILFFGLRRNKKKRKLCNSSY